VDYIQGVDVTDYAAIMQSKGGKIGDGGHFEYYQGGAEDVKGLKHRWLFNLKTDPTEQHDLQHERPDKVEELLARIKQLQAEQVAPFQNGGMNYFSLFSNSAKKGEQVRTDANRPMPPGNYIAKTASGKRAIVHDLFSYDDFPAEGTTLLNGEPVTLSKLGSANAAPPPKMSKL
jgi:hypothetical protein